MRYEAHRVDEIAINCVMTGLLSSPMTRQCKYLGRPCPNDRDMVMKKGEKMFLYYYMESQYVLESILKKRLKLSTMDSLNDPYEMLPDFEDHNGWRRPIDLVREDIQELVKNTGMICMSATGSSPGMWGHYADKHKGVAFEFKFENEEDENEKRFKVIYSDKRVVVPAAEVLKNNKNAREDFFKKMIKTKDVCWCCEQEYRWVFSLIAPDTFINKKGLYFRQLPKELTRVILGVDCKINEGTIQKALDAMNLTDRVKVVRAKLCDTGFNILV